MDKIERWRIGWWWAIRVDRHGAGARRFNLEWLVSAGTIATMFAIAAWLARQLIITRLTKSVESEFNLVLEKYRAEMRKSEEHLRAEFKSKETDILALRGGAIAAVASRQAKLDDRRLQAVDDIWTAVTELTPAKFASSVMSVLNFEAAAEAAVKDPKVREILSFLDKHIDPSTFQRQTSAARSRPYVSPMLWASFSAYSVILMQAVMRAYAIKAGVGPKDFMDGAKVAELLKSVLPHQADFIDKYGAAAYHHLVEEMETKIIHEMHLTISGAESDQSNVEQAAKILALSNSIISDQSSTASTVK